MNSKLETGNSKLRVAIFGGSGYGGSELLRILLLHPNAEIVFVTANATDANRETALKLGAKGFLSKPVRCQDLLNAVRAAISS